jgi:hypothetical protein
LKELEGKAVSINQRKVLIFILEKWLLKMGSRLSWLGLESSG